MKKLYLLLFFFSSLAMAAPPNIVEPSPLILCDNNNDGVEMVDLTQKEMEILNVLNPSEYLVEYFADQAHTATIFGVQNLVVSTTVIYIRVTEIANPSNFADTTLQIFIDPLPVVGPAEDMIQVENPFDGFATFDLTANNAALTGGAVQIIVKHFTTQIDAETGANQLSSPTAYTNMTNPQMIWARLESVVTGCYSIAAFQIEVIPNDVVIIPDPNLKARLIFNGYDTNADAEIQVTEAEAVTGTISLDQSPAINDLTGIQAFVNIDTLSMRETSVAAIWLAGMPTLKALRCGSNASMTSLNINLTGLKYLECNGALLTSLDVSASTQLESLDCGNNHIQTFDFASNPLLKKLDIGNNWANFGSVNWTALHNLEWFKCSGNGFSSIAVSGMTQLKYLDCSNNNLNNLTVPALSLLETLICGNNQMGTLALNPALPVLNHLNCAGGFLTTLDLSAYPTLTYLDCGGNHLTSLNTSGLVNLEYLAAALNDVPAFNLAELPNLKYVSIHGNEHTTLDVSGLVFLEQLFCGGSPMASLTLSNNVSLHILDCTDSQLTEMDLAQAPTLTQLNCGGNPLGSLDLSPVTNLHTLVCRQNQLTTLDVSMLPNLTVLMCNDNLLTTLDLSSNHVLAQTDIYANPLESLFIKNGSQQYFNDAGNFVENPNLTYICADEEEIDYLLAKPGMNASVNSYCTMSPGGAHNTVTGTIRFDADNNGCDASDAGIQLIKLDVTNTEGQGSVFTNGSGVYNVYSGQGFVSIFPNMENGNYFDLIMPFGYNFPDASGEVYTQDICLAANGVHPDAEVIIAPIVPARPGFEAVYKIVYRNKGNQVLNGTSGITFHFEGNKMSFLEADVIPDATSANQLTWNYSNLLPFESRSINVVMQINAPTHPANPVNVNDLLTFSAGVSSAATDDTPDDNAFNYLQTVIGSYDPNDIYCVEGDVVSTTEIGKYLHYIINFENTGTDFAENIVVVDEIDTAKYDLSSLQIVNSSDDVDIAIEGNKAKFFFRDIKLPIGGHGNILLKIKSKNTLVQGDMVMNKADIYFDYNLPITTNDAQTLYQLLSVPGHQTDESISVYPNPVQHMIYVQTEAEIRSLQIYDVQGRLLHAKLVNGNTADIDVSSHPKGVYFLKVLSDKGIRIEKIIKN